MIMKIKFIIILAIVSSTNILAQSDVRLNSYMFRSSITNPAYMSLNNILEFDLLFKNQWTLFPGAPVSLFFNGAYYLDDLKSKVGIRITQDEIGYTSSTDVDFIYSYGTEINYNSSLHLGFALSYQNQSYDREKIFSNNMYDPAIYNLVSNQSKPNADIGIIFTNRNWTFGYNGLNLFSLVREEKFRFNNTNILYTAYLHEIDRYLEFRYGINMIQTKNIFQTDIHILSIIKSFDNRLVEIGGFVRSKYEVGFIFGIDLSPSWHIYYNYDYNFSSINTRSIGSHEIMLSYAIRKSYKCRDWYYNF